MNLTKTQIKPLFAICFAIAIMMSSSCKKDDKCIDNVYGTYLGTESCPGANNTLTMIVGSSSKSNQVVFSISGTAITFNGEVSPDCHSINIPGQNLVGQLGTVNGAFSLNGNTLGGTLNFATGSCSYNLAKQ